MKNLEKWFLFFVLVFAGVLFWMKHQTITSSNDTSSSPWWFVSAAGATSPNTTMPNRAVGQNNAQQNYPQTAGQMLPGLSIDSCDACHIFGDYQPQVQY